MRKDSQTGKTIKDYQVFLRITYYKVLDLILDPWPIENLLRKRREAYAPRLKCFHNGIILIVNCFRCCKFSEKMRISK